MADWLSVAICLLYIGIGGQGAPSPDSQNWRSNSTSIHILGDESLLKVFEHCRPVLLHKEEAAGNSDGIVERAKWDRERWWYTLAHVCRRWRHIVITAASHLDICLVFTYGTPVADMLTHSLPLPLVIDYSDEDREVTVEDEGGILLALQRRRRVRRIRICMPTSNLRELIAAVDGEFPMLEYLNIKPLTNDNFGIRLPGTFKAPQLRHFAPRNITYSPGIVRLQLPTPRVQSAKGVDQCARCTGSQFLRSMRMFIHVLDDDSLLSMLYLCRPVLLDEDEVKERSLLLGGGWNRERWWYKLAHVCQRWRYLILASASHLGISLFCTYGTPVADMLAHSPPLPLIIDHVDKDRAVTAEDEEGILLALQHRDRVRRIRLEMPTPILQKLIVAMDDEFPMLEYLYLAPRSTGNTRVVLPKTFQASHLRHLVLRSLAFPIRSVLLTTAIGLVTLALQGIRSSAYFRPNDLLERLSLMPQLETLRIGFHSPIPNREVERQLLRTPIMTNVTLPNLRWFLFRGTSAYLEALLPRMTTPILRHFIIVFSLQLNFSVPHLVQFMSATENLMLRSARFQFNDNFVDVEVYPHEGTRMYAFCVEILSDRLDWQVASAAQIFQALRTVCSGVEHLSLGYPRQSVRLAPNDEVDPTLWRELLMPFGNAKTLRVSTTNKDFVRQLSRVLQSDDGEPTMELLPQLKELRYSARLGACDAFDAFVDARKNAGHPLTLIRN